MQYEASSGIEQKKTGEYIIKKGTQTVDAKPEIKYTNPRPVTIEMEQMKKLTERGKIKRYDTGIYFIPRKTIFKSGSTLSADEVIRKKYLVDGDVQCGYLCGLMFANKLGLTTQVPMVYEVCSNKATTEYRDMQIGSFRMILRRPYVKITNQNVNELQFLDLMREVTDISEVEGTELTNRLIGYLKAKDIAFDSLRPYLPFYPDKIYKNMFEVGLLDGVAT